MDCVFCNIIADRAPAEKLFENRDAISILDIRPIHYGHALVIPKQHCRTFLEVPPQMLPGIMDATSAVTRAIVATLGIEGFNIFSNNGEIAGQSVFHFHWHITPRYPNDNIRFELKLKQYSDGQLQHYGQRIRDFLTSTA